MAAALTSCAQRLARFLHDILSRCRHRLDPSVLEGLPHIQLITRRACDYRDPKDDFLGIRAVFPDKVR